MVIYNILEVLFYIVFFVSAMLLVIVILLQEGKGGGLAEAFGGVGGETFGVRASGIARFTGWVATAFIASAVLIPITTRQIERARIGSAFQEEKKDEAPAIQPPKDGEAPK